VALPRHNIVEVVTISLGESILTVKLKKDLVNRVNISVKEDTIVIPLSNNNILVYRSIANLRSGKR